MALTKELCMSLLKSFMFITKSKSTRILHHLQKQYQVFLYHFVLIYSTRQIYQVKTENYARDYTYLNQKTLKVVFQLPVRVRT